MRGDLRVFNRGSSWSWGEEELCGKTAGSMGGETTQGGEPRGTQLPKVGVGTSCTGPRRGAMSKVLRPGEEVFRGLLQRHQALICPAPHLLPARCSLGSLVCLSSSPRPLPSAYWVSGWSPQTGQAGKTGLVVAGGGGDISFYLATGL